MDTERERYQSYSYLPQDRTWKIFEKLESPRLFGRDEMIYFQGEQTDAFYYLKKGRVKIFLSSENGMEKTLLVLEPGRVFGEAAFFDGLPRMSSARAVVPSEIIVVRRRALPEYFRQEPALAMEMLRYLSRTVRILSSQLDSMAFLAADKRIARLLLDFDAGHTVSCTQEELGSLAGISRVTVNRAVNEFVRNGWVETRYREISIRDRAALQAFLEG